MLAAYGRPVYRCSWSARRCSASPASSAAAAKIWETRGVTTTAAWSTVSRPVPSPVPCSLSGSTAWCGLGGGGAVPLAVSSRVPGCSVRVNDQARSGHRPSGQIPAQISGGAARRARMSCWAAFCGKNRRKFVRRPLAISRCHVPGAVCAVVRDILAVIFGCTRRFLGYPASLQIICPICGSGSGAHGVRCGRVPAWAGCVRRVGWCRAVGRYCVRCGCRGWRLGGWLRARCP